MIAICQPVVLKRCSIFSITFLGQFGHIPLNRENVLCLSKLNTADFSSGGVSW